MRHSTRPELLQSGSRSSLFNLETLLPATTPPRHEYIWDALQRAVQNRSPPLLTPTDLWTALTATAGSDVVQSGRPIFDDFFQHLWPYTGNNTANVVFQMVKRLWLIRIDQ
ncbi:hypothetical protein TNCV_1445791 [Trichonephila clavipes]|nr:hypothetical protein TNCV_1445791 [Trichonephila clavipes]